MADEFSKFFLTLDEFKIKYKSYNNNINLSYRLYRDLILKENLYDIIPIDDHFYEREMYSYKIILKEKNDNDKDNEKLITYLYLPILYHEEISFQFLDMIINESNKNNEQIILAFINNESIM